MRVRVATTALGITAALLALPACATDTTGAKQSGSWGAFRRPSPLRTGRAAIHRIRLKRALMAT